MSMIDLTEPENYNPLPPILGLYGPPGAGKTTTASRAPKPYFIRTESNSPSYFDLPGKGRTYMPGFPKQGGAADWKSVMSVLESLVKHDHDRMTVVIDSLDATVELCKAHVLETICGGSIANFDGYNRGVGYVKEEMKKLLNLLEKLRERKILVIILAHEGDGVRQANHDGEDYIKSGGACYRSTWIMVSHFCSQIAHVTSKFAVVEEGYKKKARGNNKRLMIFNGTVTRTAKMNSGYALKSGEIPLSWDNYLTSNSHLDWVKETEFSNYVKKGDK